MKDKKLAVLFLLTAAFSGGAMIPLVKIILKVMPPMTFTFLRFLIATIAIIPFLLREKYRLADYRNIFFPVLFASLNIILFILVIGRTSANLGQMVYVTVPIIVVMLAGFFLKERITLHKIAGVILGVFGSVILLFSKTVDGYAAADNLFGGLVIFLGAILFSLYVILSKKIQKDNSPTFITASYFMTTTIISMFFSFSEITALSKWLSAIHPLTIVYLVIVGVIGTSVYYLLQQLVIRYGTATMGSAINFIQPAFTFVWASLLLGERVTPVFLMAAALIIVGAWLVSR